MRVLVDNDGPEPGPASKCPEGTVLVGLDDNRGFAGGANAGLERAFADGAAHAVLLNDDVLVEAGCIEALVVAAGDGGAASPRIDGPPGIAFAGGELELVRGFGRHVEAAERLSQRRVHLHLARRLGGRRGVQRGALPLLRGRRVVPPRPCARRGADRRAGRPRGPQRRRVERRRQRARRWPTTRRATGSGCSRSSAGRARAPRGGQDEAARAHALAVQPARRAVSQAKLAGVHDWSERRMGRGPWPRSTVAFDVACLTQTRAGTARLAVGLRDALQARREDVELIQLGDREWQERGSFAQKRDALQQDLAWYGLRLAKEARESGAQVLHCPTFRGPLREAGLPTVVTVHDLAVLREPSWFPAWSRNYGRTLMPRAVRNADRVICVSRATARDAVGLLDVPYRNLRVIPNAIEPVFSSPPGPAPLEPPYLLCVGTPEPRKNLPALLEAFTLVRRAGRRVRLALVAPTAGAMCASARPRASSRSAASTTPSCATSTRMPRRSCCRASGRASGCPSPRRSPRAAASPAPTSRRCASWPARMRPTSTPRRPRRSRRASSARSRSRARCPAAGRAGTTPRRRCVAALARALAMSREPLVLVDGDTVGRGAHRRRELHRQPPARAARGRARACASPARCATRPICPATSRRRSGGCSSTSPDPYRRIPLAFPALARREGAALAHVHYFVSPRLALPRGRDRARHLVRPRAGAVLAP